MYLPGQLSSLEVRTSGRSAGSWRSPGKDLTYQVMMV
jgi:hypothetical protein